MTVFYVREYPDGALISLSALMDRLPNLPVGSCHLTDIRLHYGRPLGYATVVFEQLTASSTGLTISGPEFKLFASADMQILDGEIEIEFSDSCQYGVLRVVCDDATSWELHADSDSLSQLLESHGFLANEK